MPKRPLPDRLPTQAEVDRVASIVARYIQGPAAPEPKATPERETPRKPRKGR